VRIVLWRDACAVGATAFLAMSLAACSGGNGSSTSGGITPTPTPVNNVEPILVDSGPLVNGQPVGFNDTLYTTVTICVPGTATCQSIDHVLLDTGSTGLRIVSSAIALTLPYTTDANHNTTSNCIQYADTT